MRGLVPDSFPIYVAEDGSKKVLGRELYKFLGIKTPYDKWLPRMIEYGFKDGEDYKVVLAEYPNHNTGRPKRDHVISYDMALHIAMIQRSEVGMRIRQKLIDSSK